MKVITGEAVAEQSISGEKLFDGRIFAVERHEVCVSGVPSTREIVRVKHHAVAVLAAPEGNILLVRQYRYPYAVFLYEVPAGKVEPNEDYCAAAIRELHEETGCIAQTMLPIVTMYPTPGFCDEVLHLYEARDMTVSAQMPDEDEKVEVVSVTPDEAMHMIESGEITDAKTIICIQHYLLTTKAQG